MWYREAKQGRLDLDRITGVENFREHLISLIKQSLVRNKLDLLEFVRTKNFDDINPLGFRVDFDKLNKLLAASPLSKYVRNIEDISPIVYYAKLEGKQPPLAQFNLATKSISIPKLYDENNLSSFLHEVVHSMDPVMKMKGDFIYSPEYIKDIYRPYSSQSRERLAFFEILDHFYSTENLKKVLEIFYIKDKKKYPTKEMATKAFMDDFKNYMQNPLESILYNPTRFHSYLVTVYGRDEVLHLLTNAQSPMTPEESKNIFGDMEEDDPEFLPTLREYIKNHPEKRQPRDDQYIGQLRKFFTNVYLENAPKFMPGYEAPVMPFDESQITEENSTKD
jgi:hypothetical protein